MTDHLSAVGPTIALDLRVEVWLERLIVTQTAVGCRLSAHVYVGAPVDHCVVDLLFDPATDVRLPEFLGPRRVGRHQDPDCAPLRWTRYLAPAPRPPLRSGMRNVVAEGELTLRRGQSHVVGYRVGTPTAHALGIGFVSIAEPDGEIAWKEIDLADPVTIGGPRKWSLPVAIG